MAGAMPDDRGMLATPDGQLLHWEVVGDPDCPPLVHLHGGPGSGCTEATRWAYAGSGYRAALRRPGLPAVVRAAGDALLER